MEIADIKAHLETASRMLDDFDSFTREAVTGLVDISRRERARAEAAEAEAAECRAERARYGDIMTSKLSTAEAEVARLHTVLNATDALAIIRSQATAIERLQEARTLLSTVYNAFGATWPQRYVEDVGAFLETSGQDAAGG